MRIIVTGGTGTIGVALCEALVAEGDEVIVLTRNPDHQTGLPASVQLAQWDAKRAESWGHLVDGAEAVIHLAGEGLADGRWTDARKQRIYASRVDSGQAVVEAVSAAQTKPNVVIQASAIGYYGDRGDEVLTEDSTPGNDFPAQVCFDWEASTAAVEDLGVRRVIIRTGVMLANEGGAWPRIVLPFKLFAGGPLGNGKQYWSWIHIQDEIRAILFLLKNEAANGAFNLTAPEPLSNRAFAAELGRVMGRPGFFPVPGLMLKLIFGEMSTILLDGQRVIPKKLQDLGFTFEYPTAAAAFRELVG